MATEMAQDWSSMDHKHHHDNDQIHPLDIVTSPKRSSLLPALPVGSGHHKDGSDSDNMNIDTTVGDLGINSSSPSSASSTSTSSSFSAPVHAGHAQPSSTTTTGASPSRDTLFSPPAPGGKSKGTATPLLQTHSLDPRTTRSNSSTSTFTLASSNFSCESPMSALSIQQPWMANGTASPKHGPLLTAGNSPSMGPYKTNSLPLPGAGSRKNSVASLTAPRVSPGFRGAPLGQTSDTESVLKQFDVYFGKVYLRGQLQKKADLGLDGHKLHGQQWAAYHAELVGPKLRITPMAGPGGLGGVAEEMNMEEATVEMQDGPNGGTFTVNWMGANRAVFQPVQQLSLGRPEIGQNCQDWVCAIRLSCYECSRLQEIYTSTLLRRPKFRDQVAATIEGPIKHEGMLKVKFWAGDQWQKLWVVVSDQRGEGPKKKKEGKILQASPIRGQIHFYENPKAKRPFISMYNVSQAYAVCPSRSSINASKDNKADEEGSLNIKLEGDVVMQRENLSPSRKGFFSSPSPPSMVARDLQDLLPTGRSHFAMFQVPNAVERTKFLLGTSEAFRIYGKPGPLLFDSPTDPAAMNFGCMASSLLQQELLIGLDAVLHLPQKGESLADVKFSFGEVLRKRLIAENPPTPTFGRPRGYSSASCASRHSAIPPMSPYGMGSIHEDPNKMMMSMPPSPMMAMAMRSRANSGSGFLVPQPSPSLHPTHMSPWTAGSPHSPQMSAYSGSPRQGPIHASPYNVHLHRQNYAASNTSTDENDANLVTDEEGEDDEYPDTPEDEGDDATVPFRSRSGSLMAPGVPSMGRKGSVGGLSIQGGRTGRSGSFTSAYGVQVVAPSQQKMQQQQQQQQDKSVLELPSLHSFSDDFGIKQEQEKEKQKKMKAVVYPTQVVIPKSKKNKEAEPSSAVSLNSPMLPMNGGGCASPAIQVNNEVFEEQKTR